MKSLYDSRPEAPCPLCGLPWTRGDAIAKWLGSWSHESCKLSEQASVASEGQRVTLPDGGYNPDRQQVIGKRLKNRPGHTRGIRQIV